MVDVGGIKRLKMFQIATDHTERHAQQRREDDKINVVIQPPDTMMPRPALAIPAPAYPPISASGRASRQTDVPGTVPGDGADQRSEDYVGVDLCDVDRLLPMGLATAVPKVKAATKFQNAAQTTPCMGVNTRVETTVAMELAAS